MPASMQAMAQMTLRTSEDLARRVRLAAEQAGRSMNDYVSAVLDAATNPDMAGDEAARLRARLSNAGLLAEPGPPRGRPSADLLAEAGRAASRGTSVSALVSDGR